MPQVPPLETPKPAVFVTTAAQPTLQQEQQVLPPGQTTRRAARGYARAHGKSKANSSSASKPSQKAPRACPRGSSWHLVTISVFQQDPERSQASTLLVPCRHTSGQGRTRTDTDTYHNVDGLLAGCADGYPAVGRSPPANALLLRVGMTPRRFAVRGVETARGVAQAGLGAAGRLRALRAFSSRGLRVRVGGLQVRNGLRGRRHAGDRAS